MLKQSLIKSGLTGRLVSHVMPWFNGDGKHPDVGYLSQRPYVIEKQLGCMKFFGVDVVCVTYSGPKISQLSHNATLEMAFQCQKFEMEFCLMLNAAMVSGLADKTKATAEVLSVLSLDEVQWILAASDAQMYEFDLAANGVDLAQVRAKLGSLALGSKHTGFTWQEKSSALAQLIADFKTNKATITMATLFRSFCDANPADRNKSVWDITKPVTVFEPRGGNFWHDQLEVVKASNPAVDVGIVWNDYQELGDGCWEPVASELAGIRVS